jgi:hypothetical protein
MSITASSMKIVKKTVINNGVEEKICYNGKDDMLKTASSE